MGSMLPLVLKKLRLDPAASSTPFVATLVDVTGIVIYFTLAMSILGGTLLATRTGPTRQFTMPTGQQYVIFTDERGHPKAVAPIDSLKEKVDVREFEAPASAPDKN
jgi:hypothetical protein